MIADDIARNRVKYWKLQGKINGLTSDKLCSSTAESAMYDFFLLFQYLTLMTYHASVAELRGNQVKICVLIGYCILRSPRVREIIHISRG